MIIGNIGPCQRFSKGDLCSQDCDSFDRPLQRDIEPVFVNNSDQKQIKSVLGATHAKGQ